MMEFDARVKKWGNSLAVVLPNDRARIRNLRRNEVIHVIVLKKSNVARKSFGRFPDLRPAQEIKDELRKELYGR